MKEMSNQKLTDDRFWAQRAEVLASWPTGRDVRLEEAFEFHGKLPAEKRFPDALDAAVRERRVLLQPRAGVALVEEHIALLQLLAREADLLPTTIDAYTRQNRYEEAEKGIEKSRQAGHSLLNGFPAVNHGVAACRQIIEQVPKPVQVRHGTPDARLLAEITLAAGFTSFEGGGISYNIPYAKKVPLEKSIADWRYVDRLVGKYEEAGVRINREPFGPLSGTLVPPFMSHAVAIIEGLLALEQGVRSITLGYGQAGNLIQDVAAIHSLRDLANRWFVQEGYEDYQLSTVFHQWMGGFPEDESKAFAVISWGGAAAALSGATKVIVKTPHEASGIPTGEANLQGILATRQITSMLQDQQAALLPLIQAEAERIRKSTECILRAVKKIGEGDWGTGAVRAFAAGILDVPFAPSIYNKGKMLPVRDNEGAIRLFDPGLVPLDDDIRAFHAAKVRERAQAEGREPCFQMVIDDIYAISKGRLVGRPR